MEKHEYQIPKPTFLLSREYIYNQLQIKEIEYLQSLCQKEHCSVQFEQKESEIQSLINHFIVKESCGDYSLSSDEYTSIKNIAYSKGGFLKIKYRNFLYKKLLQINPSDYSKKYTTTWINHNTSLLYTKKEPFYQSNINHSHYSYI